MEAPAEHALVRRAATGDAAALEALWLTHRGWVAAVLLAHGPAGVELEDLLQEVALALVRKVHTIKEPGAFRAWLRMVALNTLRSYARRARTRADSRSRVDVTSLEDPAPDQAAHQDRVRRRARELLALIHRMAPEYREPLLLRCVEGMTQNQIAATLELPETTIESRLARARRLLRDEQARSRAASIASTRETSG
jgi:RNA polymerase sigma-70 factor (ECF subfamily)